MEGGQFLDLAGFTTAGFGNIVRADLDVVDKYVIEVNCCGEIRAGHHLVVHEEFEVMSARREVDSRSEGGTTLTIQCMSALDPGMATCIGQDILGSDGWDLGSSIKLLPETSNKEQWAIIPSS